jgi:hypothetical protein
VTETETEKQRVERVYKEWTPVMFCAAQAGTGDLTARYTSNITGSRGAAGEKGGRGRWTEDSYSLVSPAGGLFFRIYYSVQTD